MSQLRERLRASRVVGESTRWIHVLGVFLTVVTLGMADPHRATVDVGSPSTRVPGVGEVGPQTDKAPGARRQAAGRTPPPAVIAPQGGDGNVAAVRGRFLLPSGEPAEGIKLGVRGWGTNDERIREHGLPEGWVDPQSRSGPDGRFELRFDPPRAFQFVLDATLDGYAGVTWRWSELSRGEVVDVGDVRVAVGGTIKGRVVGSDGEPVHDLRWMMYAEPPESSHARGKVAPTPLRVIESVDSKTGEFVLRNVPPGPILLKSYGRATNWMAGPNVTVASGETVDVDFMYDGPDISRRITVTTFGPRHLGGVDPDPAHIKLYGAGAETQNAKKIRGSSQSFAFDGLEPGSYLIEIDDPRFELWRREGVRAGSTVSAKIRGSSALQLDVRNAETKDAVPLYAVTLKLQERGRWPNEFDLHDGKEPLSRGLVDGLLAGSYALVVEADGYPPAAVPIDDLAPGETRSVRVPLGSSTLIEGRVTGDAGSVAGARVMLLTPAEVDDSPASQVLPLGSSASNARRCREEIEGIEIDAGGRYSFAVARPGTYIVRAEQVGAIRADSDPIAVASGEAKRVDLSLPASGRFAGRLVVPEGRSPKSLRVWLRPEDPSRDVRNSLDGIFTEAITLLDDGAFEAGPLRSGDVTLFLLLPTEYQSSYGGTGPPDYRPSGSIVLGTFTIPPGGVLREELSLVDRFPATLRIRVKTQGAPFIAGRVSLKNDSHARLDATTDASGSVELPVLAGEWDVFVSPPDQSWSYRHEPPVKLDWGEDRVIEIETGATTTTLVFMDTASGEPLRRTRIGSRRADSKSPFKFFTDAGTTDDEGRLEVTRTPGDYVFAKEPWGNQEAPEANLSWTQSGAEANEVWF